MTVAQVNTALHKLGADFKIKHLSDLVFLETKTGENTIDQGFVAKGNHLYAITAHYRDLQEPTNFDRGQLFVSQKTTAIELPSTNSMALGLRPQQRRVLMTPEN